MNSCCYHARNTVVIDDIFVPTHMDPSVCIASEGPQPFGSKRVINATRKLALDLWHEVQLLWFAISECVLLRLEKP
jgi:hypothetical protein